MALGLPKDDEVRFYGEISTDPSPRPRGVSDHAVEATTRLQYKGRRDGAEIWSAWGVLWGENKRLADMESIRVEKSLEHERAMIAQGQPKPRHPLGGMRYQYMHPPRESSNPGE